MMRTVAIAVLVVLAFLGASCTTVPRDPQPISQITETIFPLCQIAAAQEFQAGVGKVGWAEGQLLPGTGERTLARGWMVVVPPGHEVLKRMAATLEVRIEANPPLTVLLVRPERVNDQRSQEMHRFRGGGAPEAKAGWRPRRQRPRPGLCAGPSGPDRRIPA